MGIDVTERPPATGDGFTLDGVTVVRLPDELVGENVTVVRDEVVGIIDGAPASVVLDIGTVRNVDAPGLGLLVRCHRHARERGVELVLTTPHAALASRLRSTGLDQLLGTTGSG